jgi:hypothetical protein
MRFALNALSPVERARTGPIKLAARLCTAA